MSVPSLGKQRQVAAPKGSVIYLMELRQHLAETTARRHKPAAAPWFSPRSSQPARFPSLRRHQAA